MPCPHPRGQFQITGRNQKISHVFDDTIGQMLRVVSTGTVVVVILAQVHAHGQLRPGSVCPECLQHEVCEVLPDPVRVSDAPPVSLGFVPDRVLPEEGIDQLFDVRMFGPVATLKAPAGKFVRS